MKQLDDCWGTSAVVGPNVHQHKAAVCLEGHMQKCCRGHCRPHHRPPAGKLLQLKMPNSTKSTSMPYDPDTTDIEL